ncbi:hypothetical protein RRF57_002197 [Xylaria bambusicola]|uniref:Uncharacterized protein n=1 Tax=Xylaria bambusicola TaxID=326684 RepID=A0AAN7Z289_9PEZI
MDKIETFEWVVNHDATKQVNSALLAGVSWIAALGSMMCSFDSLSVMASFSTGTTPTTLNSASAGFQHLEQPQAWLNATSDDR